MSNLDIKFTVVVFTEAWQNYENVGLYNIEG